MNEMNIWFTLMHSQSQPHRESNMVCLEVSLSLSKYVSCHSVCVCVWFQILAFYECKEWKVEGSTWILRKYSQIQK
jgi:hypothetical protein